MGAEINAFEQQGPHPPVKVSLHMYRLRVQHTGYCTAAASLLLRSGGWSP